MYFTEERMSRPVRILLGLIVVGVVVGAAAMAYIYVRGGSGEASVSIQDAAATRAAAGATDEPSGSATEAATQVAEAAGEATVFSIVPDESQVRFEIDEDLRGVRTTVVGSTNQVAGEIRVNFDDPAQTEVGTIVINVRTLTTPEEFRNRAIRGEILLSARDEYEFGQFEPTEITGLPETVTMGEPISFQITGNLVLRGVSNPVTFDVTVTPVSETELEGSAAAVVDRTLYGMEIPSAPGVANVEEEVELYIDFVAQTA
jgi:polyisoprenoid-binding protein YceI